jgi:hypothetical protein
MRFLGKLRLVVLAVVGIPVALIGAYMAITEYFGGTGTLHVAAPTDSSLTVWVDGVERSTLTPGVHREIELEQGDHQIELVRADGQRVSHALDVDDGFYEGLAPAPNQCWVELDGTEAYYGSAPRPELEARYFDAAPFDLSSGRYFDEATLPSQIQDGHHVYLMFEVPCAMRSASDAQLIAAAGYDG